MARAVLPAARESVQRRSFLYYPFYNFCPMYAIFKSGDRGGNYPAHGSHKDQVARKGGRGETRGRPDGEPGAHIAVADIDCVERAADVIDAVDSVTPDNGRAADLRLRVPAHVHRRCGTDDNLPQAVCAGDKNLQIDRCQPAIGCAY